MGVHIKCESLKHFEFVYKGSQCFLWGNNNMVNRLGEVKVFLWRKTKILILLSVGKWGSQERLCNDLGFRFLWKCTTCVFLGHTICVEHSGGTEAWNLSDSFLFTITPLHTCLEGWREIYLQFHRNASICARRDLYSHTVESLSEINIQKYHFHCSL